MRRRGADVNVTVYPGSYHAFDAPSGTIVHRTDVPNGVNPGQGVHVGPNPAARAAANADVAAFLRSRMSPD
jgi:dienelactone hydrolase